MKQATPRPVNGLHTRGHIYRHLSEALSWCDGVVSLSDLVLKLKEDLHHLRPFLKDEEFCEIISCFYSIQNLTSLNIEYTRLFRGPVKTLVYPYESMHIEGEVFGATTRDVVKKYLDAGLEVSRSFKDMPDHICAQLEFMYYLCSREKQARDRNDMEESLNFTHFQREFFQQHLGKWAPDFCQLLEENATEPFYKSISRFMAAFLSGERSYFRVMRQAS